MVPPYEPAVLSLAGFAAWLSGDGASAWCAVERAEAAAPHYSMAALLRETLTRCLPPDVWRPPPREVVLPLPDERVAARPDLGQAGPEQPPARPVGGPAGEAPWVRRSITGSSPGRTAPGSGPRSAPASTCSRGCCASRASTPTARAPGIEIEFNLVDEQNDPALRNSEVLDAIADPDFQTELGQFNIEINVAPRTLEGDGLAAFEDGIRASLNSAEEQARTRSAPTW